jgi:ribosome silencing factor RsfS/YbeB/iojap
LVKSESRVRPRKASTAKKAATPVVARSGDAPRKPRAAARTPKAAAGTAAKPRTARSRKAPAREPDVVARLHAVVTGALEDLKARDIVEIDVRDRTSVTDLLIVASGTSTRHVKSIADEVAKVAKSIGLPPLGVEGQREAEWVLVDLGDIVVHVMLPRTREFYGLERLWTVGDDDAPPAALAG